MVPNFDYDRIKFVEFIQDNQDILKNLLEKQSKELNLEGKKFEHPYNQTQKLKDILAFSKKNNEFTHVENTFTYFVKLNLGDDPVRGELLYDLDDDEIHDDGFMENPERKRQIGEFEKWLNTEDVTKVLAENKLGRTISKRHIDQLKDNLAILSVRPMGELSEKDPGGLSYQKALGKWEEMTMATYDKKAGGKLGRKKRNHKDKTKKKKTRKYRKTRYLK